MKRKKALRKAEQLLHKALNLVVDARINKACKKDIRRLTKGGVFALDIKTGPDHVRVKPQWGKPLKFNDLPGVTKSEAVYKAAKKANLIDPVSEGGHLLRPMDLQRFRLNYRKLKFGSEEFSKKELARGYAARLHITWFGDANKLSKQDLEDAPFFTVFECWKGQCQARDVPDEWWVVSGIGAGAGEKQAKILEDMGLTVDWEEPEKSDEDVSLTGVDIDHIFDDLDAALCYLNDGGTLVKVPDSMNDDEEHWRLYVVAN